MRFLLLLLATFAWLGAAPTSARNVNVQEAKMREFIRLLDEDGNGAVTLQEVEDRANQLDQVLGSQMGLPPGVGASNMAGMALYSLDQQWGNGDGGLGLEDFGFLDLIVGQAFGMALQLMDKDHDGRISQDEIVSLVDAIPRSQFPLPADPENAVLDTNMDSQISYEEAKNGLEEAGPYSTE